MAAACWFGSDVAKIGKSQLVANFLDLPTIGMSNIGIKLISLIILTVVSSNILIHVVK